MQTVSFNAGDTIITEGEEGDTAFLIVSGAVEVIVGEGSKARTLGTLEAGEVFGEMSLIEPGPRSATVRATADTRCLATTYDEFFATIQDDPESAVTFMKTLVRRLRHMNEEVERMGGGKRGLRGIMRDWQKSLEPREDDPPPVYWTLMW